MKVIMSNPLNALMAQVAAAQVALGRQTYGGLKAPRVDRRVGDPLKKNPYSPAVVPVTEARLERFDRAIERHEAKGDTRAARHAQRMKDRREARARRFLAKMEPAPETEGAT